MSPVRRYRLARNRRAVVLILTLWMVLVLTLLANSLAFEMQIESKLTGIYRDQFCAEQFARIGIARAVCDLRNDRLYESSADADDLPKEYDALGDLWTGRTILPRHYDVTEGRRDNVVGQYEFLIVDEESKLGLNSKKENFVDTMRYLLEILDIEEDVARKISFAIYDWKDFDDDPKSGEGESERVLYTELRDELSEKKAGPRVRSRFGKRLREDEEEGQYLPKNARFDTVDELLQIPGITPELFYGYDPEEELDPEFFAVRSCDPNRSRRQKIGLRDLVTVRTTKLNPNTASYECLAAALATATNDLDTGRDLAESLINHRQGRRDSEIDNEDALRQIDQLGEVDGFTGPIVVTFKNVVPLTLVSDYFTIYSRGNVGEQKERLRSSLARDRNREQHLPTCHIIAECRRKLLTYPIILGEDGEEDETMEIDPNMPAFRGMAGRGDQEAWMAPVVYFRRWNSY